MIRSVFREIQRVYGPESIQRPAPRTPVERLPQTRRFDSVAVSTAAERHQRALRAAEAAPEVREGRIADVSQELSSGTYTIRARRIASMLMREGDTE